MNICVLTHTFPRNNKDTAAAFMKEFSDGLVSNGNRVFVLTPFAESFDRKGDRFKLITYKYIWPDSLHKLGYSRSMYKDVSLKAVSFLLAPFMIFFGSLALIRLIKRQKVDIINVHWIIPNGLIALIASKLTGVPYVVTLPGTDAYLAHKNRLLGLIAKVIAGNSSGITSNSSLHLKRILALGKVNKRTGVISYPVDVGGLKPSQVGVDALRKKLGISKNQHVVMAIGRLVYKKGFAYLISAMKDVIRSSSDVKLIIGGDGDLMADLLNQVRSLKLSNKVSLIGSIPRDEISTYYNLCDVFVSPSIIDRDGNVDGGPVVAFESMACAKAQVVTSVLGVSEYIKDDVNGYVVAEKDSASLAKAINKLLKSDSLRKKMGRANRELILNELSTKKVGLTYTKFFSEVLKDAKK